MPTHAQFTITEREAQNVIARADALGRTVTHYQATQFIAAKKIVTADADEGVVLAGALDCVQHFSEFLRNGGTLKRSMLESLFGVYETQEELAS